MVMETNWYVITGGPCTGKTQTIGYLSFLGYHTVLSPSRVYINVERSKGSIIEEIRANEAEYQKKILDMKINQIDKMPPNKLIFFERGLPDSIAYYKHCGEDTSSVIKICREIKYKGVFLLDKLPYEKDYARVESEVDANALHKLIKEVYLDLDYNITEIPVRSIDERAMMILDKIKRI
jgi:predicted ATPase